MSDQGGKPANIPLGRKAAQSESELSHRESLDLKRRLLLEKIRQDDSAKNPPVPVVAKEAVPQRRRRSQQGGRSGASVESSKGSQFPLAGWLVVGLGLVVLLLASTLFFGVRRQGETAGQNLEYNLTPKAESLSPDSSEWVINHSAEVNKMSLEALSAFSETTVDPEGLALLRNQQQVELFEDLVASGRWSPFDLRDTTTLQWALGLSEEHTFIMGSGVRRDFRTFTAFFVKIGDEMRLDLAATEGVSEVPIEELASTQLNGPSLTRCWVRKEPHFDSRWEEGKFSWFQILAPNEVDFVWAYAAKGGLVDQSLREQLNYGRLIEERKDKAAMTVTLTNAKGGRDDEFFINEVVTDSWVLPVTSEEGVSVPDEL